jgi:hypothetical protein
MPQTTLEILQLRLGSKPTVLARKSLTRAVFCADGTDLSVQASCKHYCNPRTDEGPYAEVEVGFPSVKPPEGWRGYCDGDFEEFPTDAVYLFVPIDLVAEFIDDHGGFAKATCEAEMAA